MDEGRAVRGGLVATSRYCLATYYNSYDLLPSSEDSRCSDAWLLREVKGRCYIRFSLSFVGASAMHGMNIRSLLGQLRVACAAVIVVIEDVSLLCHSTRSYAVNPRLNERDLMESDDDTHCEVRPRSTTAGTNQRRT